jgi:hypothetical protein
MPLLLSLPFNVEIDLKGDEKVTPTLLELTNFLYDFNLGYELARLATDPRYEDFRFSRYALYRNGRPLRNQDRLQIERVEHSSPLVLQTVLLGAPAAIGAIWIVVQIAEKVSNWKLNRQKLEEEIKKLQRENMRTSDTSAQRRVPLYSEEEYLFQIENREAKHLIDGVTKRLEKSEVHIQEIEIRFVRRTGYSPADED